MRAALGSLTILIVLAACMLSDTGDQPTVREIPNPALPGARFPFPAPNSDAGTSMWSWLEPETQAPEPGSENASAMRLVWAAFDGENWSGPEVITRGEGIFANWADFPSLAGIDDVPVAAHWPQKIPGGTYAYHVNMAFRSEAGVWSRPIIPHADRSQTEHGFVSMVPLDSERVLTIWLDGYRMKGPESEGESSTGESHGGNGDLSAAMSLRSVVVHRDGTREEEIEVDSAVCDCCQTSAVRSGNRVVAIYRNRSENEIRDIYRAVYDLDQGVWSPPLALSNEAWEIAGCPVNGPQIAASGETVIGTWFTAADGQPRSYFAVSRDGGQSFGEPQALDGGASTGRVGIAFNHEDLALMTWIGSTDDSSVVFGRLWQPSGIAPPFVIGQIDASRASGFPRVAATGAGFLVAWTEAGSEERSQSRIKTLFVSPGET